MMSNHPLKSIADYSRFVAELFDRPTVQGSTVSVWSASPYTGVVEGEVLFASDVRLRVREELDFDAGLITSYGYEVYQKNDCTGTTTFHIPMTRHWLQPFLIISISHLT